MPPAQGKEEAVRTLDRLARDERGATAIEYGLILALIFLAMLGALTAFGQSAIAMWTGVAEDIEETRVQHEESAAE